MPKAGGKSRYFWASRAAFVQGPHGGQFSADFNQAQEDVTPGPGGNYRRRYAQSTSHFRQAVNDSYQNARLPRGNVPRLAPGGHDPGYSYVRSSTHEDRHHARDNAARGYESPLSEDDWSVEAMPVHAPDVFDDTPMGGGRTHRDNSPEGHLQNGPRYSDDARARKRHGYPDDTGIYGLTSDNPYADDYGISHGQARTRKQVNGRRERRQAKRSYSDVSDSYDEALRPWGSSIEHPKTRRTKRYYGLGDSDEDDSPGWGSSIARSYCYDYEPGKCSFLVPGFSAALH